MLYDITIKHDFTDEGYIPPGVPGQNERITAEAVPYTIQKVPRGTVIVMGGLDKDDPPRAERTNCDTHVVTRGGTSMSSSQIIMAQIHFDDPKARQQYIACVTETVTTDLMKAIARSQIQPMLDEIKNLKSRL